MSSLLDIINNMEHKCNACGEIINNSYFIACSNKKCKKTFDIGCVTINQQQFNHFSEEYKKVWVCPDCIFAHFTCLNVNSMYGYARMLATRENAAIPLQSQAATHEREQPEDKLQKEFTAFRSEITERFDKIENHAASLPNVLVEELCYLNTAGQTDLYSRIKTMDGKFTTIDNRLTGQINRVSSRVVLLEKIMGTIHKQLMEMGLKKRSPADEPSVSDRSNGQINPKTSESGVMKPAEELRVKENEQAAALGNSGDKEEEKKAGEARQEDWRLHPM